MLTASGDALGLVLRTINADNTVEGNKKLVRLKFAMNYMISDRVFRLVPFLGFYFPMSYKPPMENNLAGTAD